MKIIEDIIKIIEMVINEVEDISIIRLERDLRFMMFLVDMKIKFWEVILFIFIVGMLIDE